MKQDLWQTTQGEWYSLFLMEHRSSTSTRHLTLFCAVPFAWCHISCLSSNSAILVRLQMCWGTDHSNNLIIDWTTLSYLFNRSCSIKYLRLSVVKCTGSTLISAKSGLDSVIWILILSLSARAWTMRLSHQWRTLLWHICWIFYPQILNICFQ